MRALARYIARCHFADFLLLYLLFPLSFSSILPRLLAPFLFFFYLVPHQVSNHLPFAYTSLTTLSSTPLHHEIQLRFIPPKLIFILLDSLACPKISITIYLFICLTHAACCMLHACTKTFIAFVSPWRIKVEEMIYFFLALAST